MLYLIIGVLGAFAELFVRQILIKPGDAVATANNIMANEWLFRIGFMSDLIMLTCWVVMPLALYKLLKPVNKNLASLFVLFALVTVPLMMLNMVNQFAALLLLSGDDYLIVFGAGQLHAQVLFFLNLHKAGYYIAQIPFGIWLLPLGYLVFKSGYFPRILGVVLMIGCFGYLIDAFIFYLSNYEANIGMFTFWGELLFPLWLLLKGAKIPEMKS